VNIRIGKAGKSLMDMRNQAWADMKGLRFYAPLRYSRWNSARMSLRKLAC
jgi:hypothetical protein